MPSSELGRITHCCLCTCWTQFGRNPLSKSQGNKQEKEPAWNTVCFLPYQECQRKYPGYNKYESMKDKQIITWILDEWWEASLVFNSTSYHLQTSIRVICLVSEMDCGKEVRILPLVVLEENNPSCENVLRKQTFWIQRRFQWIVRVYTFLSDLVLWSWVTILSCGSWGCLWAWTANLGEKLRICLEERPLCSELEKDCFHLNFFFFPWRVKK